MKEQKNHRKQKQNKTQKKPLAKGRNNKRLFFRLQKKDPLTLTLTHQQIVTVQKKQMCYVHLKQLYEVLTSNPAGC